jgi:hypothetical protein
MSNDILCIRKDQLSKYPNSKLGSAIYRLTHEGDTECARFMDHLIDVRANKFK